MNRAFSGCSNLKTLPDISKWNTGKVDDVSEIFYGCSSLKSFPDLSKWNINKIKNTKKMFYGCKSSLSLSDISKVDDTNITNIKFLFNGTESFSLLPILSNSDNGKVINFFYNFDNCKLLFSLSNLSKLDYGIFYNLEKEKKGVENNCNKIINDNEKIDFIIIDNSYYINLKKEKEELSLKLKEKERRINKLTKQNKELEEKMKLLTINKNKYYEELEQKNNILKQLNKKILNQKIYISILNNKLNNADIFSDSEEINNHIKKQEKKLNGFNIQNTNIIKSIPNIQNNNNKKTNMSKLFSGCKSLITSHDISKWDTSKVSLTDISCIFAECKSLICLPDISKWNALNIKYMQDIFSKCE